MILLGAGSVRPIAGDAEADVFVGIRLLRIDLADESLGRFHLLELLGARREADLLIAKIAQYWALIISLHGPPLSLLRLPSCAVVVFLANPSPTAVSIGRVPCFERCSTDGQGNSVTDSNASLAYVSPLKIEFE